MLERSPEQSQTPEITLIIENCPRDTTGMYEVGQDRLVQLEHWMNRLGVLQSEPVASQIAVGATHARELFEAGLIDSSLSGMDFISENRFKSIIRDKSPVNLWLEKPLYAKPEMIFGAVSFASWLGRGYEGSGQVNIRERRGHRTSKEQIIDYATRETQLPYLGNDGGLNMVLHEGSAILFSSNAHRAAAAKLRNEPLGFRRLTYYS